jgi:membrane-associated HD superfamily phosphohydrolase
MKNTVLRYGIWSALSICILFLISSLALKNLDFKTQEIYGYASIVVSLLFVFFGIKHFRDLENSGLLSFGKGLLIGLLITLFASTTFGLYNVIYVEYINPDFMTEYYSHSVEQVSKTLSGDELQAKLKKMEEEKDMFSSPLMNFLLMFLTVFMIGFIISLISSLILSKKTS